MDVSKTKRIVLLGKTGAGKSSLANTIFGGNVFTISHNANSQKSKCEAKTASVKGQRITLIDTPGFFDTDRPEEEMKPEIVKCITECSPGPHAFLIVLKVEKYTKQENDVIKKICEYFSEEVYRYATVLFTHGDQLQEGQRIEDFLSDNKCLIDLVKKCGGRCHVVDNKYWNQNPANYRSNQFQVVELLKTLDKMMLTNKDGYYTNEMLQEVEATIRKYEEIITTTYGNMPKEEIRKQAKGIFRRFMIRVAGVTTGALVGAFFGVAGSVAVVFVILKKCAESEMLHQALHKTLGIKLGEIAGAAGAAATGGAATAGAATGGAAATGGTAATGGAATAGAATGGAAATGGVGTLLGTAAVVGVVAASAVAGGCKGYAAAERAETELEASKLAAAAVTDEAMKVIKSIKEVCNKVSQLNLDQSEGK